MDRFEGFLRSACVLVCIAACWLPSQSHALVEIEGRSEVAFRWSPAAGPVAGYVVGLERTGWSETYHAVVSEPEVQVDADFGDELRIRVAAFDAQGNKGPWSSYSATVALRLPPIRPAEPDEQGRDLDGDGVPEVALRSRLDSKLAYLSGLGSLLPTEAALPFAESGSFDTGHGDFDGDGTPDIVWQRTDSPRLAMTLGGVDGVSRVVWPASTGGHGVAGVGDFDADGRDDLLMRDPSSGSLAIWYLDGNIVRGVDSIASDPGVEWRVVGVMDYDGDGRADILWRRNDIGRLDIWPMEGSRVRFPLIVGEPTPAHLRVVASGDFDRDGLGEILLYDQTQDFYELREVEGRNLALRSRFFGPAPLAAEVVEVADYTLDGWPDLLWYDGLAHELSVWRMLGQRLAYEWTVEAPLDEYELLWPMTTSHPAHPLRPEGVASLGLCPGDINGDGVVNAVDSRIVVDCFAAPRMGTCAYADINGDGVVSNLDQVPMRELEAQGSCD